MKEILISKEPIELNKLLKFENLASSGGEANHVINEGLVTVNGSVETRKRKKIKTGDIVAFRNQTFFIKVLPKGRMKR